MGHPAVVSMAKRPSRIGIPAQKAQGAHVSSNETAALSAPVIPSTVFILWRQIVSPVLPNAAPGVEPALSKYYYKYEEGEQGDLVWTET